MNNILPSIARAVLCIAVITTLNTASQAEVSVAVSPTYTYMVTNGGAGGYEAFPDICRLQDGRIMGVFYAGYAHVSPPIPSYPNGGRVMYVTSDDKGATWSVPTVLYDGPNDDRGGSITQLPSGRLMCNFPIPYQGAWITNSDDGGATWSTPVRVNDIEVSYPTSSPIRQLSTGRLIMGLHATVNGLLHGAVTYSDDGGVTWETPVVIPTDVDLPAETDVIELAGGTLWAAQRQTTAGEPMYYSTSTDWGETWSNSQPLGFHGECPYLHRTTHGGMILLGYRGEDAGGAKYTALRYSLDECATWSNPITVDTVEGAYPSMVNLGDGSVLIAYYEYNSGSNSNIRVRTIQIVPEPGGMALLATGLIALLAYAWWRRK